MPRDEFSKIDEEFFNTILDEDFQFEGDFQYEDSLIIKGVIKGNLVTKGDLIVGPDANIEADVRAATLQCFGKITGNVVVEKEAFFHSPAQLKGDLTTPLMTFEKGCRINGQVRMTKSEGES